MLLMRTGDVQWSYILEMCGASPIPQLQSVVVGGVTWRHRGASMYYLGAISEIHS